MVVPIIAAIGLAAAGIGGGILGSTLGGGKKEIHAAKEHYAPVTTDASALTQIHAPTYQYQIESPKAIMTSKKDIDAIAESAPEISTPRTTATTPALDLTTVAVIGVVGLVAYGLVSK